MGPGAGYWWKRTPFVKLLVSLSVGIILQRYGQFSAAPLWLILLSGSILLGCFFFLPFFNRYQYAFFSGTLVFIVFTAFGALLTRYKDIRNNKNWFGHTYTADAALIAEPDEPLTEKASYFKAVANARLLFHEGRPAQVKGKIIIYFSKDSSGSIPLILKGARGPGTRILFKKTLLEIKGSGNPGGFDYGTYCWYKGITHQVFLKKGEFELLPGKRPGLLQGLLYRSRERVLDILKKYIPGEKEPGLAEALLIGHKDDLDPELVRSYSNTGVVHIIAISGLHLGLVYWLLSLLLQPFSKSSRTNWLRPFLIIAGLWAFSFLAGAQPSVLRSALMFTFIVLGESLSRKTSVYNSMAASAFLLLCINPFWLWDIGFQLSYAAVMSIIIFMRPIYNWFYCKNKVLDLAWKMNAVTLAAQVLTLPLCIYHFHQFPSYFLLTNFLAVPLSSIILLSEIFLCVISFIPAAAGPTGQFISMAIGWMNRFVENTETLPGSVWDGLQFSLLQVIFLFLFIAGISYWLLERSKKGLAAGLLMLTGFLVLRSFSFIQCGRQQMILVYNIPHKRAVDLIQGRKYIFTGDSDLLADSFNRNFHLRPARTLFRISPAGNLMGLLQDKNYIHFGSKKILLIDETISFARASAKQTVDLLIISRNPKLYIKKLAASFSLKQVVFDSSTPVWKVNFWKKDCDSLRIPWYDVREKGAFVMRFR